MWYSRNFNGVDEANERKQSMGVMRFWMKPNTEAELTFIDDEAFSFNEHNLKINGNYQNFFTCPKDLYGSCPLCESGNNTSFVTMFTVIDHRQYYDKKNQMHVDQKKLFAVKSDVAKTLQRKKQKLGGLKNKRFTVFRKDKLDFVTGSDFDFIAENDVSRYKDHTPVNYEQLFKPKEPQELIRILRQSGYAIGALNDVSSASGASSASSASSASNAPRQKPLTSPYQPPRPNDYPQAAEKKPNSAVNKIPW